MMTEARLPNGWIHHTCIVEIWVIWVAGNIGEIGKGRIVENWGLCEVVRVDLRVFLHITGEMSCFPAILCIFKIKTVWESQVSQDFGCLFFFFQAEDGIRDHCVTGVQTCALPI